MTTVIGEAVPRSDGEAKVRGSAVYGIDYEEPHYLHGKVLRSSLPAAAIKKLDVSKALEIPGVLAIITASDVPGKWGLVIDDQPLMAEDVVRYEGEPIAAVAAETWNQARAALKAIELELEPLEVVGTMEEALDPAARAIHPDLDSYSNPYDAVRYGNVGTEVKLERGDVDAAFERAAKVVETEHHAPRHHQASIEPRVCVARYDNGRYVIHTSTQWPYNVRDGTAAYIGVRPTDVRVIVPTVGGGFGGKLLPTLEPMAALLAKQSGRPVKLVNTRKEEFLSGAPRENGTVRIRTALAEDGSMIGHDSEVLMDNGAYSTEQPFCAGISPMMVSSVYRFGAIRNTTKLVYTNTPPTGPFRGVLGTYAAFALERHIDQVASELGEDRRAFRQRHHYVNGDEGPTGQKLTGVTFDQAFERLQELAPWREPDQPGGSKRRGIGLACAMWQTNVAPAGCTLMLNDDGTVSVNTAATEIGSGAVTQGLTQIVAGELGLRPEDVIMSQPDTALSPYDGGAQGGRTVFMAGRAALEGAQDIREQILETASSLLEADASDLELVDGTVRVIGAPDRRARLSKVARVGKATEGPIMGNGGHSHPPLDFDTGCIVGSGAQTFAGINCHIHQAEVEVDVDTGEIEILSYAVVQDVGKAINPAGIEGQIQGGVVQGVGYALYEDHRYEDGVCVDLGFNTYRLPTALDAPAIDIALIEEPDAHGPLGAKGAAEAPIIPVAGAIANAVSDAIGAQMDSIPITPFRVLEALNNGST